MNPMQSILVPFEKLDLQNKEEPVCPITLMPFNRPWILLEDGFTYEKDSIKKWLENHPNKSPMIGEISSATILPNCTIKKNNSICPITQEHFVEPYYCAEDGFTYEKDAIIKWFEIKIKESLEQEIFSSISVRSPASGVELNSLTLYPNKILFNKGIPHEQKPLVFKIDINQILSNHSKNETQEIKCVFDQEIRNLIESYVKEEDHEKTEKLKEQINERRLHLGLNTKKMFFDSLDLSHLNLSKMNLQGLHQKSSIFKETDLSSSVLTNCSFSRCRFLNCNMQKTFFINCDFRGGEVSFFKTDMKDAIIEARCYLEKGSTWNRITNWSDFKDELSRRGAVNVDSVTLRNF